MAYIINICAIFGITASTLTNLMSQVRVLRSYAKDGLFFKIFKDLDPVTKVPVKGAWIVTIPIVLAAFVLNLK